MRLTSKGQVTIPQEIRERLGLLPQIEVEFEIDGRCRSHPAGTPRHGARRRADCPDARHRRTRSHHRSNHGAHAPVDTR